MQDNGKTECNKGGACGMPFERKVPLVAGSLILLGFFLAHTVSSIFMWVPVIVGGMMVYEGLTGNCLMTMAIKKACGKSESCS